MRVSRVVETVGNRLRYLEKQEVFNNCLRVVEARMRSLLATMYRCYVRLFLRSKSVYARRTHLDLSAFALRTPISCLVVEAPDTLRFSNHDERSIVARLKRVFEAFANCDYGYTSSSMHREAIATFSTHCSCQPRVYTSISVA